PVDIALPGVLPVMNKRAAELAIRFGLAIGAEINQCSTFERKNYFYPDLPKAYQISQFQVPIVGKGQIDIETDAGIKTIGITRAHLEEDAGKSVHDKFSEYTGVDLNRTGTPLLEIVSDPDMRSAAEAVAYLRKMHAIVRYVGISDGNMQEGSFRCDANISVRPTGQEEFGTRAEIKNINSFRFVERAINYEIERQIDLIEAGGEVVQETRLYDPDRDETRSMRSKEEAHDYRYFPDPDLPPMSIDDATVEAIRSELPELPEARAARYVESLGLSSDYAANIVSDRATADYFDACCELTSAKPATVFNWINAELSGLMNKADIKITASLVDAEALALLLDRIEDNTISGKIAKDLLAEMWTTNDSADELVKAKGLKQITDSGAIENIVKEILAKHPAQVEQYKAGETKMLGFFVGQVMKASQGKANPKQANEILRKLLGQ
ncbi:MAG: Asp-tRNA(Asn)/Glu-tRNA(Gln) amidotransferase subunit GatB, partial [Methylococcales bacterium]|nr:Asp-tRNA(Asn)/Glu-tRNA(Gln) amidotransferase subunit GatB [Methylococcales bacterium]